MSQNQNLKKQKRLPKNWVFFLYLFLLHAFVAIILIHSNALLKVQIRLGIYQEPEITKYYAEALAAHKRLDSSVSNGAVIFIGDSNMESLATSEVAPFSVNYGIGADTTFGVLKRIPLYKSIDRASAVIFAIGGNDRKSRSLDAIVENYAQILNQIPSHIPVVISAPFPKDERVTGISNSNAEIQVLNAMLEQLARSNENVTFVNPHQLLIDRQGQLDPAFHVGDGVHLSEAGYALWIQQLKDELRVIVNPKP